MVILNPFLLTASDRRPPKMKRKTLTNRLDKRYKSKLDKLNKELQNNLKTFGTFSLTFDVWTATMQTSFIGVTLSYIESDMNIIYKQIGKHYTTKPHYHYLTL